jgi:hypothetical protein
VASTTHDLGSVDVRADGAVAWAEVDSDDLSSVHVMRDLDSEPVVIAGEDVACPRWRADGSLMVTVVHSESSGSLAVADIETGETGDPLPVRLGLPVCASPAGPDAVVFVRPVGETYGAGGAEVIRADTHDRSERVVGHIPPYCWANDLDASPDGSALAAGVLCGPEVSAEQNALYVGSMRDDLAPLVADNTADTAYGQTFQYWRPSWSADGSAIAFHRIDPARPSGNRASVEIYDASGDEADPRHGLSSPALSGPSLPGD